MKKALAVLLTAICVISLAACSDGETTVEYLEEADVRFDVSKPIDVTYKLPLAEGEEFLYLEGGNAADGDYYYRGGYLVIKRDLWVRLGSGTHTLFAQTTRRVARVKLDIDVENMDNKIVNGGFETGDLFGWERRTAFKAEDGLMCFTDSAVVVNDTFYSYEAPYGGEGRYVLGFDDRGGEYTAAWCEKMGVMRSSVFTLAGSGFVSFMLGGAGNGTLCYVSVKDAETGEELKRFANHKYNETSYSADGANYFAENLVRYKADLSEYKGRKLYFEVTDLGGGKRDMVTLDGFVSYYAKEPDGVTAVDIKPSFDKLSYVPNEVENGDFSSGLDGWTLAKAYGGADISEENAFVVDGGTLKSNGGGNESRGVLRSSLFKISGCGVIGLDIGAARGKRFDKDTFVSVREYSTNRELIRFCNRNGNGVEMIRYYADLSEYSGRICYFEIVDNATGDYDTIFVANVQTFYATAPDYDYYNAAVDLNC